MSKRTSMTVVVTRDVPVLLSRAQVIAAVSYSRSQIDRLERAGRFPRRIKLGSRRVAWRADEIAKWVIDRSNERY